MSIIRLGNLSVIVCGLILLAVVGCNRQGLDDEEGPSPEKTPQEELATFEVAPGLDIQLVASEPMVQEPVVIMFDPGGRLWVVEMRGFMPDIDGKGEKERVGRISVLEDLDNDGKMDQSKIYIDSLIMPRALALVPGGALIVENEFLWMTQDLNGDLKADSKTLIDSTYAGNPSIEHSANGLWRGIDNWYYNAKSSLRYRIVNGRWIRDSTEFRGQWGISHDDEGRLYYNYNWSQLHADLVPPNYLSRNKHHTPTTGIDHGLTIDRRVYPIRPNPAVNRGYIPGTLDSKGRLQEFTAACSPLFYRGTALPNEYYGNVFVCEPSGNLIKRNVVKEKGVFLSAYDPSPGKEFVASTDERFRPVFLATGPDGALYVADMYRGLVQHGMYVTPYLREQTLQRKLVGPINRGRIWRIVPKNWNPPPRETISRASIHELVGLLSHPDGWHRDIAQQLLVERAHKKAKPLLEDVVEHGSSDLSRFHALWTLEGLDALKPDLLYPLLHDSSSLIRTLAVRLLEKISTSDNKVRTRLGNELSKLWQSAPVEQALQISLSSYTLDQQYAFPILSGIVTKYDTSALVRDAVLSSLANREENFLGALWSSDDWQVQTPGKDIFIEMLTTAIVRRGMPDELISILAFLDGKDPDWRQKSMLTALAIHAKERTKPIQLSAAPDLFTVQTVKYDPSQVKAVSTMFEWPGHIRDTSALEQSKLDARQQKQFVEGRQLYLTTCVGCHGSDGKGLKRFGPPLTGSDWVLGDEKRLALILLHGMEGPIHVNGKLYDAPDILPVMPSHSTLDDASISSILTYIRNEWGNAGGPVSRRLVGMTRVLSQGRVVPWTAPELDKHIEETKSSQLE